MRSNIDFELAYEQLRSRVIRTINCKYFPKNILLKIWNNPLLLSLRLLKDFLAISLTILITVVIEILDATQKLQVTPRKEIGLFCLFLMPFIAVSVALTPLAHKFLIGLFPGITILGSSSAIFGLVTVSVFLIYAIIHDYIILPKRRKQLEKTDQK